MRLTTAKILTLIFIYITSLEVTYAIKGDIKIDVPSVKESSCKLTLYYPRAESKPATCSGILIDSRTLVTAKHCLYKDPKSLLGVDINSIDHFSDNFLSIDQVEIQCNGLRTTASNFEVSKTYDLAKITLKEAQTKWIEVATKNIQTQIQKHELSCASFGFGLNQDQEMGNFNGVIIDEFKAYKSEEAFIELQVDADFKAVALVYSNSFFPHVIFDESHFPNLFSIAKANQIDQQTLKNSFDGFQAILKENGLNDKDIFNPNNGPLYKKIFVEYFYSLYFKVYSPQRAQLIKRLRTNNLPEFRYITNVTNSDSQEKSGIDYGDSGGAFACKKNNEWYLAGINSKILLDSNLGWSSRPWQPMNSRPESRVTKNGEIVPLINSALDFILK